MFWKKANYTILIIIFFAFLLNSCANRGDARKSPPDPKERVKRNIEEGRGFRLMDSIKKGGTRNFDFASSNELWRASLDTIDFMPLASVNYSGGIIVTDWYSANQNSNENVKISIRFLTNEIRSDALDIKIFNRKCSDTLLNCNFTELSGNLVTELKKEILKKASKYKTNSDVDYKYPKGLSK